MSQWLAGRRLSFDLVFLCSVILGESGAINSYTLSCVVAPLAATPVCVQHGVCVLADLFAVHTAVRKREAHVQHITLSVFVALP